MEVVVELGLFVTVNEQIKNAYTLEYSVEMAVDFGGFFTVHSLL